MASTNKTTNYNLSQYIGSDKPTYLGDYNSDMLKIDTQMKTNADNISSATASAQTALENASTALTNANGAQTSADNAQVSANSAQGTATNALNKATNNEVLINQILSELNINSFENFGAGDITVTNVGSNPATIGSVNISVAKNTDGTLAKIYGTISFTTPQSGDGTSTFKIPSSLRPEQDITINALGERYITYETNPSRIFAVGTANVTIKTDGTIEIPFGTSGYVRQGLIILHPCLLFIKQFGDTGIDD